MDGHRHQVGEGGTSYEKKCSPFFYARSAVERPCCTCCGFCCVILLFLLVLVGSLLSGVEIIRFSTEVPFYLYDATVYKNESALRSAFDVANARLDDTPRREREEAESNFELRIIYELDGGETMFTPEILARIRDFEEELVAVEKYEDFCALTYEFDAENPTCVRQASSVSFFDPEWWLPLYDPPSEPTVASIFNAELLLDQSKIGGYDRDNYYAFADPEGETVPGGVELSDVVVATTVAYWAGYCSSSDECPAAANDDESPYAMIIDGNNVTVANQLAPLVDTEFGVSDSEVVTTARALRSVFFFGSPQVDTDTGQLYEDNTDDLDEQRFELGTFLHEDFADILNDGIEGVNVFWSGDGNGMLGVYVDGILASDSLLLLASVLFIVLYLVFQLRSWWLGGVGLLMILENFPPALLIYRFVSGYSYFGTLNALAIFLVLGIGADDIFVYSNTWKHIRLTEPDLPVLVQLHHALSRGGKAMLVTSVTTAVSFLINASSAFPAVQSFGIFSAVLIMTNFFSVITLYPAATMVYEYHMHDPEKDKNCCRSTCHSCRKEEKGYATAPGLEASAAGRDAEAGGLSRCFRRGFYPVVHGCRFVLLSVFVVILIFYIVIGSQLEPESETSSLLPDSDQYTQVGDKVTDYFSHSDTTELMSVYIPFGIARLDRDDCDGDPCDPTVTEDYGEPIWDSNIEDISDEYTQKWFLDFCEAMASDDDAVEARNVYEADEAIPTPVECIFNGLQTWYVICIHCQSLELWCNQGTGRCNQTHPILTDAEYIVDADGFEDALFTFLADELPTTDAAIFSTASTNYDVWEEHIRFEAEDETSTDTPTLRFVVIEALLSSSFDLKYGTGINLYDEWKDFLDVWLEKAETEEYMGADTVVSSGFVTDAGVFHWFFVQERIVQEAFTGIGVSLVAVFIIVCIATSNWLIALLATFNITAMVGGVIAFTVGNGWNLGVLEAILFVMVVGFSVDYTIHLSDSYLESSATRREDRVRDMLATMGPSVLSGAISTLGATFPLFFAYFTFFLKFGMVIFFIIAQSLVFSLVFYAAILDVVGPEQPAWGDKIERGRKIVIQESAIGNTEDTDAEGDTKTKGAEGGGESVRYGKVVGAGSDSCRIELESKHYGRNASESILVPTASCRGRYETGHIVWLDTLSAGVASFLGTCCFCCPSIPGGSGSSGSRVMAHDSSGD